VLLSLKELSIALNPYAERSSQFYNEPVSEVREILYKKLQ